MPKSTHQNFCIVDKLFKFTFCLLGYIPRIVIISIFNNIATGFYRHVTETIFKIAYLRWSEKVICRSEHDRLRPIVNRVMRLLHPQKKTFAIFANSGLTYVHHCIICLIYGHNMRNGTMFADLKRYVDREFLNAHRVVKFETVDGIRYFTVIEVLKTNISDAWYDRIAAEDGRCLILSPVTVRARTADCS